VENHERLNPVNRYFGPDLNRAPSKYNYETTPLEPALLNLN